MAPARLPRSASRRNQRQPKEPQRDQWFLAHPYPMPPNFTGRRAERAMLSRWLSGTPRIRILSLRALGRLRQERLVWHWLTTMSPRRLAARRVVELLRGRCELRPLPGRDVRYLVAARRAIKIAAKIRRKQLLQFLHAPGTLLVLDGFERCCARSAGWTRRIRVMMRSPRSTIATASRPWPISFSITLPLQPPVRQSAAHHAAMPEGIEAKGGGLLAGRPR